MTWLWVLGGFYLGVAFWLQKGMERTNALAGYPCTSAHLWSNAILWPLAFPIAVVMIVHRELHREK